MNRVIPSGSPGVESRMVGDELVVVDTVGGRSHSLNPTVSAVFASIDGTSSVTELAARLQIGEPVAVAAVAELEAAGLVRFDDGSLRDEGRRRVLRNVAIAGAAGTAFALAGSVALPGVAAAATGDGGTGGGEEPGNGDPECNNPSIEVRMGGAPVRTVSGGTATFTGSFFIDNASSNPPATIVTVLKYQMFIRRRVQGNDQFTDQSEFAHPAGPATFVPSNVIPADGSIQVNYSISTTDADFAAGGNFAAGFRAVQLSNQCGAFRPPPVLMPNPTFSESLNV